MSLKNLKSILILLSVSIVLLSLASWLYRHYDQEKSAYIKRVSFHELPGWEQAATGKSLQAFQTSCKVLLKERHTRLMRHHEWVMSSMDWQPVCQAALEMKHYTQQQAKAFFETWFEPIALIQPKAAPGLFTGYFVTTMEGRLHRTARFNVPVYGLPDDLVTINLSLFNPKWAPRQLVGRLVDHHIVPYYTRKEIDQGALKQSAPVLVWLESKVDRLFMEIEGSGIVQLNDGSHMYLSYAGQNGAPYTAVGKVLIEQGVVRKKDMSMQRIQSYFTAHPEQVEAVIHQNASFVFFRALPHNVAYGVKDIPLTPGYSLAVDQSWIPIGAPLWLSTTRPDAVTAHQKVLQRLMIAQDTGGAIRGMVRGDVFWGQGERARAIAGKMKNKGYYWLLLPRPMVTKMMKSAPLQINNTPLAILQ